MSRRPFVRKLCVALTSTLLCTPFAPALPTLGPTLARAASTSNIKVIGASRQSDTLTIFTLVNAARSQNGLPPLSWDSGLDYLSILRAAELSVRFSHTRPNGSSYASLSNDSNPVVFECIASGQSSAREVAEAWLASAEDRSALLNPEFNSIGLSCFFSEGSGWHWVLLLGKAQGTGSIWRSDLTQEQTVAVDTSTVTKLDIEHEAPESLGVGDTLDLAFFLHADPSSPERRTQVDASCLTLDLSNTSVAALSGGTLSFTGMGATTLTASIAGRSAQASATFTVDKVGAGWQHILGKLYYFDAGGNPLKGWQYLDNAWYYFDPSTGAATVGWLYVDGAWYYFDSTGVMARGWRLLDGLMYFLSQSGAMVKGWHCENGSWYYFGPSGAMAKGWCFTDGAWYYFDSSGVMATGWRYIEGSWYYLRASGSMAASTWEGWYYLTGSGAMAVNGWTPDGYYVGGDGAWIPEYGRR